MIRLLRVDDSFLYGKKALLWINATRAKAVSYTHLDVYKRQAFPEGAAKANPFTIKGNIATGPGVVDMKACLVGCLYALLSLIHI